MISHFKLTSTAATVDYHADAFDKERTREGALDEQPTATWGGTGAHLAGFEIGSKVERSDFEDVLNGKIGGQQIAGGYSAERDEKYHKPGMDFTFSPGKSVSVMALVGGDDRIKAAHTAAVEKTMQWLEQNGSRARVGGPEKDTGNLLYAKFDHETSRKNDPQLHTHVVIANATFDKDSGKWKAMANKELLVLRKEADAVYGKELEKNLQSLGYRTEPGKSGPEIQGINPEQREAFSVRSSDIEKYLGDKGLTRETASPGQKQLANLATRPDKSPLPTAQLKKIWQQKAQEVGLDVKQLSAQRTPPEQLKPREPAAGADVAQAVEKVVDGMKGSARRFDTLAKALPDLTEKDASQAVETMRSLRSDQYPKTVTELTKAVREELPGRYVSQEKVKSALDTMAEKGKLEREPGAGDAADRYAIDRNDADRGQEMQKGYERTQQPSSVSLEKAVGRVVERIGESGKMFDAQALLSKNSGDREQVKAMLPTLTRYRNEQSPKTSAQIASAVRNESPSLKYTSNERVQAVLDKLQEAGAVKRAQGAEGNEPPRYSPEPDRSTERTATYRELRDQANQPTPEDLDKAVAKVFAKMDEAGAQFDRQAASALGADSRPAAKAALPELAEQRKEQAPKSAAQVADLVRNDNPDLKYTSKEQVQDSLDRLESSGAIQRDSSGVPAKYSTDFEKNNERYSTYREVQNASQQPTRAELDSAMASVVANMRASQQELNNSTESRREAWQKNNPSTAAQAESRHSQASKEVAFTVPDMREKIKEALERSGVMERLTPATEGKAERELDDKVNAAILRAVDKGDLHKNLNKLSVETEAQTDKRLAGDNSARAEHKQRLAQYKSEKKTEQRTEQQQLKAQERKDAAKVRLQKAGYKSTEPSVAREMGKLMTSTVRVTARAVSNPKRAATKFLKNSTVAVTKQVIKTAVQTPAAMLGGVGWGVAAGTAKQLSVITHSVAGNREKLAQIRDDVISKERMLQKRTGYYKDDLGNTRRMEISAKSAVLSAGIAAITISGLGKTIGGKVARNVMISELRMTKVSATEATLARATIAVGRQVGRATHTVAGWGKESAKGYAKLAKKGVKAVGSMAAESAKGLGKAADYITGNKDKPTVEKAVGGAISVITDKSRIARVLSYAGGREKAAELSQEARKEAYGKYIKATVELGERQREMRQLPQKASPQDQAAALAKVEVASQRVAEAKRNLVRVGQSSVKVMDRLEAKTFTHLTEKKVSEYTHQKVVEQRDALKSAVEELKQNFNRSESLEKLDKAVDKFSQAVARDPSSADYACKVSEAKDALAKAAVDAKERQLERTTTSLQNSHTSPAAMKTYLADNEKLKELKALASHVSSMDTTSASQHKRLDELVDKVKEKLTGEIKATLELRNWQTQNQQRFTGLNNREMLQLQAKAGRDHIGEQLLRTGPRNPPQASNQRAQNSTAQGKGRDSREKSYGPAY